MLDLFVKLTIYLPRRAAARRELSLTHDGVCRAENHVVDVAVQEYHLLSFLDGREAETRENQELHPTHGEKPRTLSRPQMELGIGFEPMTCGLQSRRSTN